MYFLHTNEVKIQLHGLKTGCKVRTHTFTNTYDEK